MSIFKGPTTLGLSGLGADPATIPCTGVSFVKAIQSELVRRGYPMKVDGSWGGCTASAWLKEVGAPLTHKDQVQQFLGKSCSTGYISPFGTLAAGPWHTTLPSCSNGQDVKKDGGTGTGTGGGGGGGTKVPPNTLLACPTQCAQDHTMGSTAYIQCLAKCADSIIPGINIPGTVPGTVPVTPPGPGTVPGTVPGTTSGGMDATKIAMIVGGIAVAGAVVLLVVSKKKNKGKSVKSNQRTCGL